MVEAAIVGASGYTGGELLRLLLFHPHVKVVQVTSESWAGKPVHLVHPNLREHANNLSFISLEKLKPVELLFSCLPHGITSRLIEKLAKVAKRIVDLSADFRLKDPGLYARFYGEHPSPHWLSRFVYGLPELHRGELFGAHYVSGVGCNAAVTILALWPLYREKLVRECVVEVKVGSSEGGSKPTPASHHPERAGVVRAYAPAGHRHVAELIQELSLPNGGKDLHFSVISVEMVRGALATCYCSLTEPLTELDVWEMYRKHYEKEPFVRLVRSKRGIHRFPEPKILVGSNHCDIGFSLASEERLVVIAAIDNLMKGAAGNAVQAMNVMYGFPETTGLQFPGLHPI